jgi:transcription elongation factor GreA
MVTERPMAGASEVMRALGLLVDGPVRWGYPVPSRAPGVFVVDLPGGQDQAPIDRAAVARWLARVPGLLLDGQPTTPQALGHRLAEFWLPGEPILYVGRSARAVGARVAALYATPLGDAKPHPGGHWLKTLAVLSSLRVWWAETDAHEEYEDALIAEVRARATPQAAAVTTDADVVLPFANLSLPTGPTKPHGLEGALRQPDAAQRATEAEVRRAQAPVRERAARKPATRRAIGGSSGSRPAPDPTYVSQAGLDQLAAELEQLRTEVRPQVIARVKAAREHGDLKENAEYEYARKEQSFTEGRIQTLEALLKSSVVVDAGASAGAVGVGSTVVVESDGEQQTYVVVGSSEADPSAGRISYGSPVGRALLGRRAGDEVTAQLPSRSLTYRILEVR